MIRGVLSEHLSALDKGYPVDTKQGGFPVVQDFEDVQNASATYVLNARALTASGETITSTDLDAQPDNYRCLTLTGNQATVAGDVSITGHDWAGHTITQTTTVSGTATFTQSKPFKTVLSVTLPALVAASDAVSIGISNRLGLARRLLDGSTSNVQTLEKLTDISGNNIFVVQSGETVRVSDEYPTVEPASITNDDDFRVAYLTDVF